MGKLHVYMFVTELTKGADFNGRLSLLLSVVTLSVKDKSLFLLHFLWAAVSIKHFGVVFAVGHF